MSVSYSVSGFYTACSLTTLFLIRYSLTHIEEGIRWLFSRYPIKKN
jgi:hypothetical protein